MIFSFSYGVSVKVWLTLFWGFNSLLTVLIIDDFFRMIFIIF